MVYQGGGHPVPNIPVSPLTHNPNLPIPSYPGIGNLQPPAGGAGGQTYVGDIPIPSVPQLPELTYGAGGIQLPEYLQNLPGGFQAPDMGSLQVPEAAAPSMPTIADLVGQSIAAAGQMPHIPSLVPQIQSLGQQQALLLTEQLNQLFAPQREAETERLESRGLTGAGVAGESQRRLAEVQGVQARQALGELSAQNLGLQIEEQQRVRALEESRYNQITDLSAKLGIAGADIEAQYGLQTQRLATESAIADRELRLESQLRTDANNLALAGRDLEAQQLQLQADELAQTNIFRNFQMNISKAEIMLDARGQLTDESRQEMEDTRIGLAFLIDAAKTPGLSAEERQELLAAADTLMDNAFEDFPASITEILGEGGSAGSSLDQRISQLEQNKQQMENQARDYYQNYGHWPSWGGIRRT